MKRRTFLRNASLAALGSQVLFHTGSFKTAIAATQRKKAQSWPQMQYTTLGRTGFEASRLVYGCGAALSRKPADELLNTAFDHGVNVFDVGTSAYYGWAQHHLSAFANQHRDDIFLITKDFTDAGPYETINSSRAKEIASTWIGKLDGCLRDLKQDHVDAYYIMGANNPELIKSEEIFNAFTTAKQAGKVSYLGASTHQRAQEVLEAATETGWYDLAMIAITPAGWYDWESKSILPDSPNLIELKPVLDRAKEAGIALVGMKAVRILAGMMFGGRGRTKLFDDHYDQDMLNSELTAFQRAYAYVLNHGMDVVNSDIQNFDILEQNFAAIAKANQYA